jgi:hypothetical protein
VVSVGRKIAAVDAFTRAIAGGLVGDLDIIVAGSGEPF